MSHLTVLGKMFWLRPSSHIFDFLTRIEYLEVQIERSSESDLEIKVLAADF